MINVKKTISALLGLALISLLATPVIAVTTPVAGADTMADPTAKATCGVGLAEATGFGTYRASARASIDILQLHSETFENKTTAEAAATGVGFGAAGAFGNGVLGGRSTECDLSPLKEYLPLNAQATPATVYCGAANDSTYEVHGSAFYSESSGFAWILGTQTVSGITSSFATPLLGDFTAGQSIVNVAAPNDLIPVDLHLNGFIDSGDCSMALT